MEPCSSSNGSVQYKVHLKETTKQLQTKWTDSLLVSDEAEVILLPVLVVVIRIQELLNELWRPVVEKSSDEDLLTFFHPEVSDVAHRLEEWNGLPREFSMVFFSAPAPQRTKEAQKPRKISPDAKQPRDKPIFQNESTMERLEAILLFYFVFFLISTIFLIPQTWQTIPRISQPLAFLEGILRLSGNNSLRFSAVLSMYRAKGDSDISSPLKALLMMLRFLKKDQPDMFEFSYKLLIKPFWISNLT